MNDKYPSSCIDQSIGHISDPKIYDLGEYYENMDKYLSNQRNGLLIY